MSTLPSPGSRFGRYLVEQRLGHGGMGVVYAARDTRLNRQVALKVVSDQYAGDPVFVERFLREADVLGRLDSPHVISIYDSGDVDGRPYIASQFVSGGDLGSVLAARGPMPVQHATRVCAQVAEALQDAHDAGIVHLDVKPSNVLVRDPDAHPLHVYLCDFGIASTDSDAPSPVPEMAGSWDYLAPERVQGQPGTPASDIYALGCVLWACLSGGSAPYTGSDHQIARGHVGGPVPQLASEGADATHLNEVLARALAKDPRDRHPDARSFRQHLLGLAAPPALTRRRGRRTTPAPGYQVTTVPGSTPARGRVPLLLAAGLVLLLVAGVVTYLMWPDSPSGETGDQAAEVLVAGDQDGDGRGDVVVMDPDVDQEALQLLSNRDGRLAAEWKATSTDSVSGDVDGDGDLDLFDAPAPGSSGEASIRAIGPDALEGWDRSWSLEDFGDADEVYFSASDVDGDSKSDLLGLSTTYEQPGMRLWVIPSGDGFGEPALLAQLGKSFDDNAGWQPWVVDVDGDQRADLVEIDTDARGDQGTVRLGDGKSFAVEATSFVVPESTSQTVADVDGEPGAELVTYEDPFVSEGSPKFMVNRWTGETFGAAELLGLDTSAGPGAPSHLGASDIDGDGRTDLLLAGGKNRQAVRWFRSNGTQLDSSEVIGHYPCPGQECSYNQARFLN